MIIFIGGNDFIHALGFERSSSSVNQILRRAIVNLERAVETIFAASPHVQVFIATVPDIMELPEFAAPARESRLSTALSGSYTEAIGRYNRHFRMMTITKKRVSVIDLAFAIRLAPRPDRDHVLVAGRKLDRTHPANSLVIHSWPTPVTSAPWFKGCWPIMSSVP